MFEASTLNTLGWILILALSALFVDGAFQLATRSKGRRSATGDISIKGLDARFLF